MVPRSTRIKICGVREPATVLAAAEAGADAIGLVVVEGSPRQVTIKEAQRVVAATPAFVEAVALFVNTPVDEVRRVANVLGIRTVQLHGDESPHDVAALEPLRVIKAVSLTDADSAPAQLAAWRGLSNLAGLLFDTPPHAEQLPGGSGRTFDWRTFTLLRDRGALNSLAPIILAGGLNAQNVAEAIRIVHPFAVDV
ncbi:MAG: phosphoribosylanthranilate isomerase, partial [Pirellulaceae bacterium]|nr:phosphoribosylanthranilate isomerase [Pirellulaceae bacterium]